MNARRLLVVFADQAAAGMWALVLAEEAPVRGQPVACAECPLRVGGELRASAEAALRELPTLDMRRIGCHAVDGRPCAGAVSLARHRSLVICEAL